jgi:hypothetical protein
MPWWGWLLIGLAVVGIGILKMFVFNNWNKKRQEKSVRKNTIEED